MKFTEDEKMTMKLALAQYVHIKLDDINLYDFDLKKLMIENGIDIDNKSNKIVVSIADKIENL